MIACKEKKMGKFTQKPIEIWVEIQIRISIEYDGEKIIYK